jgi:hypothetical protein
MQFARTTGPFLEHELVDPVDAAGRRLLDDAALDAVDAAGGDTAEETDAPVTESDRTDRVAPGGRER